MDGNGRTLSESAKLEQRGLTFSVIGALGMSALGFAFAAITGSDAVLLDGIFSLIGFAVGLIALRVASIVARPDDERFNFGYAAYEPMLNLVKGLLMIFVSILAGWASVESILNGGTEVRGGAAVVYALVAAAGCLAIAIVQRRLSRRAGSPLLEVDARNWLMDGIMSGAVAVAFGAVVLIEGTDFAWMIPYADPVVVLLLVAFSLPIPFGIIRSNWGQLLGKAPDLLTRDLAQGLVDEALSAWPGLDTRVRLLEQGRFVYLHVYVVTDPATELSVAETDRMREEIARRIDAIEHMVGYDVIFTQDTKWVDRIAGVIGRS